MRQPTHALDLTAVWKRPGLVPCRRMGPTWGRRTLFISTTAKGGPTITHIPISLAAKTTRPRRRAASDHATRPANTINLLDVAVRRRVRPRDPHNLSLAVEPPAAELAYEAVCAAAHPASYAKKRKKSPSTACEGKKKLRSPGIEPGPPAWQARILPLDQLRLFRL